MGYYKYNRKSFIMLTIALVLALVGLGVMAIREYRKNNFSLSERDMVCMYFFYQHAFLNKQTHHCSMISERLPLYDVKVNKQYCMGEEYVVELASEYTEAEHFIDNPCGYPEKVIFSNCSDTVIDGYYSGTVYSEVLNGTKVAKDSLKYGYLHSYDREKLQMNPYPFQSDSPEFIEYCLENERLLSPVLKFILQHKGYL